MSVQIKRVYDAAAESDGYRVLVDRLWPRGLSKAKAHIDHWLKDIAPSTALRQWYHHDPEKWDEFRQRYFRELDDQPGGVEEITKLAHDRHVIFVFSAKDETHNNAVALKEYMAKRGVR